MTPTEDLLPAARTTRRLPGVDGFWVFIGGDLAIFSILFASYVSARGDDVTGFVTAQHTLSATHGGINTLLLLTSSWCVARALAAVRSGAVPTARLWLRAGLLGGLAFVASKAVEYTVELTGGHDLGSDFFAYYFALTGIHLAHVVVGCLLITLTLRRWSRGAPASLLGFESTACYWHMVDLLWVVIFPLLYLLA